VHFICKAISRFIPLFYLIGHPLVPRWLKLLLWMIPLYIVWPRDLVFDFPAGIGHIDDLLVMLIGIRLFNSKARGYIRRSRGGESEQDNRTISTTFREVDGDLGHEAGSPKSDKSDKSDRCDQHNGGCP
jgi:uncharacterized membrane protein YkvA (DUF1232 family)